LIADMGVIFLTVFTDLLINNAFLLAFMPFVVFLLIWFFEKDSRISRVHREFIIEFSFIATGLLSAVI